MGEEEDVIKGTVTVRVCSSDVDEVERRSSGLGHQNYANSLEASCPGTCSTC